MYGGPPEVAGVAAAVAIGESGGRTDATANEPDGSTSRGLWQINSVHGSKSSYDVAVNTRAAVELYKNRGNFTDWTVYNKGIYKQFLNGAPDVAGGTGTDIGLEIPNPLDGLRDIAEKLGAVIEAGEWFADVHNIIRIVQVVMGGALVLIGIAILNMALAKEIAGPVIKAFAASKGIPA